MFLMSLGVIAGKVLLGRPVAETFLFTRALAVGLAPERLPAVLAVNLGRSALALAAEGVLVRHLNALQNLGSMEVLCTDKTGTLTEGRVQLSGAEDTDGRPGPRMLRLACVNTALQAGLPTRWTRRCWRRDRPSWRRSSGRSRTTSTATPSPL